MQPRKTIASLATTTLECIDCAVLSLRHSASDRWEAWIMWWYASIAAVAGLIVASVTLVVWAVLRRRTPALVEPSFDAARDLFHLRREMLEAKFLTLAAASGKPRGVTWADCDFDDHVSFARDRHTRQLRALVAVTIRFEAIEGGDMEDNPNVGNPKAATALFKFDSGQWATDGRAIFNLNPQEAIRYHQNELEAVE
jgi:hypothetical protein